VADCALVSVTLDEGLNSVCGIAEWSIAVDAVVASLRGVRSGQNGEIVEWFVDRNESVTKVDEVSIWVACGAEIPIWAVEALVTNTVDILSRC
jgi:hypothetical protein